MNIQSLFTRAATLAGLLTCPSFLPAQGINLADAMKPAFEAMARQMAEMMRRRLVMNPEATQLSASDTMVTITVTNNHEDSARTLIKLHKSPPPAGIPASPKGDSTARKPKRSLLADEGKSDTGAVYKDLTPWVTTNVQEFILGPGESKTVTVSLRIPSDIPVGEYATWVAAHVVVGKRSAPQQKTIAGNPVESSSGKSYKVDIQGIPTSIPPGTQIISATKLLMKK